MDEKTAKALEESIKHWEENVQAAKKGRDVSIDPYDCALCKMFMLAYADRGCTSCPVYKKTGESYCHGTPYYEVMPSCLSIDSLASACQAELDFLKSLRDPPSSE